MKPILTLIGYCIILVSASSFAETPVAPGKKATTFNVNTPSGFIENKGQFLDQNQKARTDLLYMFQGNGMKVQLMTNSISFELYTMQEQPFSVDEAKGIPHYEQLDPEDRPTPKMLYKSSRVDVAFIGANPNPEVVAEEAMPDYLNYFLAYTPVKGITRVKEFNKITYKNLYNNIDLVMVAKRGQSPQQSFAYDFVVHPGGNVNDIKYRYDGDGQQLLFKNGNLQTVTQQGTITESIPESFVMNKEGVKLMPVNVSFDVKKNVIGFRAGEYDKKQSLVIDPLVIWATYCGGTLSEEGRGLTTDSLGNVALIGRSNSTNNIATVGAYQEQLAANVDIILEKYDSLGVRFWGTYYGGSEDDHGRGLVADKLNNYYLGCHANSPDGLATPGAYRENYAGGTGDDAVLSYFSADGDLIFGTYYGGTDDETIRRLCIDNDGNVLMVGYTFSDSGIATPGVYQEVWSGGADLCLSKWTPDGQLIWGSYLGGTEEDHGRSVTIDKDDNIYVNGSTASDDIGTPGVSRPDHAGKQDFLMGKFTTDGQIDWVSYWGGALEDRGRGVFVDSSSRYVYFTGYSASDTGVATPGAYQQDLQIGFDGAGEPFHDMVLMKWDLNGHIQWSSYLGGAKDDRGRAITMIGDNEIYISGSTESADTMATPDGFDTVWGGKGDMFLEIWDSNGVRNYGSYFGGTGDEDNLALAIDDKHQNIYLVGTAQSTNLATPGTAQPVFGGNDDALLVKIQLHLPEAAPTASFSYVNVPCDPGEVEFMNTSLNADQYVWDFGDGSAVNTQTSPVYTYASVGSYDVTLISTNSTTDESDTITTTITVLDGTPIVTATAQGPTTFCEGDSVKLVSSTGPGYTYKWKTGPFFIPGATDSTYTATQSGDYKVSVTIPGGCVATSLKVTVTVNPRPAPVILEGAAISFCQGSQVNLTANIDASLTYQWLNNGIAIPGATSSVLIVTAGGNYSVTETNSLGCDSTSSATVVTVNPAPVVTASATNSATCLNSPVTLSAFGAASYVWQPDNISGQSIEVSPQVQTTYTVTGTDINNCQGDTTITIDVLPLPVVNLGNDTTVCDTNNFVLDAGGGFTSYLWSTGAITQTITVSSSQDYWVVVEDNNTCKGSDTIYVTVTICTGLEDMADAAGIKLYPNPSNGNFVLSFSNPSGENVKVELENLLGQKLMDIYEGQATSQFTREISAGMLPSGMYNIKIYLGREIMTKKLIISK